MIKLLVSACLFLFRVSVSSAQEFFTNIQLPTNHQVLDYEAVEGKGIYILTGKVDRGYHDRKNSTRDAALHFFDESLELKWSVGIFEELRNWESGTLKILTDPNSPEVGLVFRIKVEKQWTMHAVLVDSISNAKALKYDFPSGTEDLEISGAVVSRSGIHAFCEAEDMDFTEFLFSFSNGTVDKRHTFDPPIPYPELIGRQGDVLLIQDPLYSFCNIHEYDLVQGKPLRKLTVYSSNSQPSFLLRPSNGLFTQLNQYSMSSTFSIGANGQGSTTYSFSPKGGAYISLQWLEERQRYVSLELHSDTIKNKSKIARRNYFIDAFVIREFDKYLKQISYHLIPFTESLIEGKTRMARVSAVDKGFTNVFHLSPESDTTYLISAFATPGNVSNLIRVNTVSNRVTNHNFYSSNKNTKITNSKGRDFRELRATATYSTVDVNHFPPEYYSWLKKKGYSLGGNKQLSVVLGDSDRSQFYFLCYDQYGINLAVWRFSPAGEGNPKSVKLTKSERFAIIIKD